MNRERRYDIVARYHEASPAWMWTVRGGYGRPGLDRGAHLRGLRREGELLFVAVVPAMENDDGLAFCFDHGMIGFDTQPGDYPKVYLLRPEETL